MTPVSSFSFLLAQTSSVTLSYGGSSKSPSTHLPPDFCPNYSCCLECFYLTWWNGSFPHIHLLFSLLQRILTWLPWKTIATPYSLSPLLCYVSLWHFLQPNILNTYLFAFCLSCTLILWSKCTLHRGISDSCENSSWNPFWQVEGTL
jgi:hypothetical protein